MNDLEKTKFLFEQTCSVIGGALTEQSRMPLPVEVRIERLFDAIYPVLERKLEEKLGKK
ncbi:hypothetical protein MT226_002222 [Escherichia coli]|nr:hypothetical protein [Escherichia coli]HDV1679008.1 hypothetical protein [Escherichia coli]HDV2833484.1 hypothetical protein [Escherichia coli]